MNTDGSALTFRTRQSSGKFVSAFCIEFMMTFSPDRKAQQERRPSVQRVRSCFARIRSVWRANACEVGLFSLSYSPAAAVLPCVMAHAERRVCACGAFGNDGEADPCRICVGIHACANNRLRTGAVLSALLIAKCAASMNAAHKTLGPEHCLPNILACCSRADLTCPAFLLDACMALT